MAAALAEAMQLACDAALAGDLGVVQQRLREAEHLEGYSINAKGTRSRTPLYQSCLGRNPEIALWLLEQGAQDEPEGCGYVAICATGKGTEDSTDPGERTAAIMRRFGFAGKPKKVKQKKQKKKPPQPTKKSKGDHNVGGSPKKRVTPSKLLELAVAAAAAGDTSPLLTRGGKGQNAELPIHHAARTRNVDALTVLLATDCAKEQLLSAGKGGKLPAHYAVETKDVASLQLMIAVGGAEQLVKPDSNGRIPLQYALSGSSTEVPLVLLAAGTAEQCLIAGENGQIPLHHAASMGDEQLLSALLTRGNAEQQALTADNEGRLPVHNALRRVSHSGGAARVASVKRCVGALVEAAGASQLGVRDGEGSLAVDYVLAALAEAEASARAELEKAEEDNSSWVRELETNHKQALESLETAHTTALEEATRLATVEAADKVQAAEGKRREAEGRAVAAEERTKEVEAAMRMAGRRYEEELALQRAVQAQGQLAGSYHANDKGEAPRESVESLPLSPPRGPRSLSGSWDGPLVQQNLELPVERRAEIVRFSTESATAEVGPSRFVGIHEPEASETRSDPPNAVGAYRYAVPRTPPVSYGYGGGDRRYGFVQEHSARNTGAGSFSTVEAKGRQVVDIAGRVNVLAQELSAMLAAPSG